MKGIEKITGRILQQADQEAEEIHSRTRDQVAEIAAGYDGLCREARRELLEKARETAQEQQRRLQRTLALERRKALLEEKQEMIDAVFQEVAAQLQSLSGPERTEVLTRLALRTAQGGEALVLNPADRETIGPTLVREISRRMADAGKEGVTLSSETREIMGGFILTQGLVEQNCSYEVLLRSYREELALEVSRILFP